MTPPAEADPDLIAWADSGLGFLTGRPDGPALGPPPGFVSRLRAIAGPPASEYGRVPRQLFSPIATHRPVPDLDPLALLAERAAVAGIRRRGDISCGGAARLLPAGDGWLCVNLPRPDDLDLLPAWLPGVDRPGGFGAGPSEDVWSEVADAIADGGAETLAGRAQLLGLAVAALPSRSPLPGDQVGTGLERVSRRRRDAAGTPFEGLPVVAHSHDDAAGPEGRDGLEGVVVADLSSLWAGPVCSRTLQRAGARVIKVESIHRPDGARRGPAPFFDRLHAGQESVALDFRTAEGRETLRQLLGAVDIVIEGSRPRALEQIGVSATELLGIDARQRGRETGPPRRRTGREGGARVWLSITGYGRGAGGRDKVAFGDDAAVAGGLVAWDDRGPCFLADAVADPCTGVVAAAATRSALSAGGRWLLDVALRDVAAYLAGPGPYTNSRALSDEGVTAPEAAPAGGRAPALGEHTAAVLEELLGR